MHQRFDCKVGFDHLTPAEVRQITEFYEKLLDSRETAPGAVAVSVADNVMGNAGFSAHVSPPAAAVARVAAEIAPHMAPAAPPAPPAPPAAAPAAPSAAGDVDAKGVPYNPKLHSGRDGPTGGRNQDGSWKLRKGASRDEYNAWATQSRIPAAPPPPVPAAAPAAPAPSDLNAQFGAPPVAQHAPAPAWPAAPPADFSAMYPQSGGFGTPAPAAPAAPPAEHVDYAVFVALVQELSTAGKMTAAVTDRVKYLIGCNDEQAINRDPVVRTAAYHQLLRVKNGEQI